MTDKRKSETVDLSYSRLMSHMTCPMMENYKYRVRGVGLKTTAPYTPFIEGEIGHYALKHFYRSGQMLRENLVKRITKIIDAAGPLSVEVDDDLRTSVAAMVGICLAYKSRYYGDIDHFDNKNKLIHEGTYEILFTEEPFEFDFEGYKFRGMIDLVVRHRKLGKVYLIEHKFTSGQLAGRLVQLPMDLQGMIYCEAVKQKTGKYPDFKMWNFIKKSQLRRKKVGEGLETMPTFEARVQQQYTDEPEKMFLRSNPIPVEGKMIESVKMQLIKVLHDFELDDPAMRFTSCLGLFGKTCDFIQACTARLLGRGEGWDAPECQGLYKLKECQHEELKEDDDDKGKKPVGKFSEAKAAAIRK